MNHHRYSATTLIYVSLVLILGLASALFLFNYPSVRMWDPWPFLFFGALALIATSLSITFQDYLPSRGVIQISSSFVYALFFLTHPGATCSILILLPIFDYFFNRRKILTVLFNIGQLLFSLAVSMFIWTRIGTDEGLLITSPQALLAALLVLVIFSIINHFLTNIVIHLATKKPFLKTGLLNRTAFFNESAVITLGLSMGALWTLYPPLAILSVIPIAILFTTLVTLSKKESKLIHKQAELTYLNKLALEIGAELDMKKLSKAVVKIVADSMHASGALLAFYDSDPSIMHIHSTHNIGDEKNIPHKVSAPVQNFLLSDEPYISNSFSEQLFTDLPLENTTSYIILPISILKEEKGILAVFCGSDRKNFDSSDAEWLRSFGEFLHIALANAALYANLKTTQRKLLETEKLSAIGMLVSGVAHELNNPLTSIIGYADLLHSKLPEEKDKKKLERIASEAQRAAKIVQNLSTFAKESTVIKTPVNINTIMQHVLRLKRHDFSMHSINCVVTLSPHEDEVLAESNQIEQVFLNILNNAEYALKLRSGEKRIAIETIKKDGFVEIRISDNGSGISEENLKKIFLPFFTTKEVGRGTGLGLSICYGIIDEHGGKIHAESELGKGTTFFIQIPFLKDRAKNLIHDTGQAETQDEDYLQGKRILIIDDEQSILEFTSELLSMHGIRVETSTNGLEALEKIKDNEYDLIVTDIKMPVLNGKELYHILKEQYFPISSKILFMTGDTISEDTKQFINDSNLPFISKPFSSEDFFRSIVEFLHPS